MKIRSFLVAALALFSCGEGSLSAPSFYERPYVSSAFSSVHEGNRLPLVIAHKAHVHGLPPNTLAGIKQLLETDIGGIEIDIQLSKEGVPFIFHDEDLQPKTTGQGPISDLSAQEMKQIRYLEGGKEHPLPSLEEVFQVVGNKKILFLDIKDNGILDSGMARAVARLIQKYGLHQTVVVETFNPMFLNRMKKLDPKILVQFDYLENAVPTAEESPEQLNQIPWILKQPLFHWFVRSSIQPDILGVRFSNSKEEIRKLSQHGYPVIAWTIDEVEVAEQLLEAGALGVQTNRPAELLEELSHVPTVQDASLSEEVIVDKVVEVVTQKDIEGALEYARKNNKHISIAGSQHSMGGQSYAEGNVILKMARFNQMVYDEDTQRLHVQSGATWEQIQPFLDNLGRSVIVMQSDTVFSVGGSLGANVHGWQVGYTPLSGTIHSFTLMLADGKVVTCSRKENSELFQAVIGGYGLFGVVLEVELETCANRMLVKESNYFTVEEYPAKYKAQVADRGTVQLAYGRLSLGGSQLLKEASLNTFRLAHDLEVEPLKAEKGTLVKRKIFRFSERSEGGKYLRWIAEKRLTNILDKKTLSRNNAMHPDIHVLWNEDPQKRDVLQEYFIPKANFQAFVDTLRTHVKESGINLINVTIREVLKDKDALMAYANEDVFAFVLFFSQSNDEASEERMKIFTEQMIDKVLDLRGTFYLPYRLHYRLDQFHKSYPMYGKFIALKKKYDPQELFTSQFWEYIKKPETKG